LSCSELNGNHRGGVVAMQRSGTRRFWRKFAAGLAAYAVALQVALSGFGLATLVASDAAAFPICSEHAADPADAPSHDSWLCQCATACFSGWSVLSDPPAVAAFSGVTLPANLSDCGSPASLGLTARTPQIPRAPPAA
jgi:hypothetical protein